MSSVCYTSTLRPMDDRMIAALRLILAVVALLIMSIDSSELSSYGAATYTSLAFYIIYSTALFVFALRRNLLGLVTTAHWIDVG